MHGVSTRSVDDLIKAMGASGVSKSQVSRLVEEIEEQNIRVTAGGDGAFAGEHTDTTGHWGTVHAALRSGLRAAQQVLGED